MVSRAAPPASMPPGDGFRPAPLLWESIMNILLWYLPYAIFSGARDCEVVMSEGKTRGDDDLAGGVRRAKVADQCIYVGPRGITGHRGMTASRGSIFRGPGRSSQTWQPWRCCGFRRGTDPYMKGREEYFRKPAIDRLLRLMDPASPNEIVRRGDENRTSSRRSNGSWFAPLEAASGPSHPRWRRCEDDSTRK